MKSYALIEPSTEGSAALPNAVQQWWLGGTDWYKEVDHLA
jgi:hypothetical protein